jgi:hypothetical protein
MNLQDLQTAFQQKVLDTECTTADWIKESPYGLSSKNRLAIYHNAYRVRLIDVLLDTFEHTAIYLGDDWFCQLAAAYVQSHQSTQNNIGLYGRAFPEYLAERLADDLEVAELANMDWTLRRAFDGADSAVMTMMDMQKLASGKGNVRKLRPVATLSVTTQHFNTLDIWHAIDQENQPPVVEPLPHPVEVLIWRKEQSPHFRSLSPIEATAIRCIRSGQTLEVIGEKLVQDFPEIDAVTECGQMLSRWIEDQVLATVTG